jgi:hypothetical protein
VSPFGHKDDDKQEMLAQWRVAQAEFERLNALPMIELATEVMIRGFGSGSPGADDDAITLGQANVNAGPTAQTISYAFAPERAFTLPVPTPEDVKLRDRIAKLVAEGLQELEHASLVRCQMHTAMGTWTGRQHGVARPRSSAVRSNASCSAKTTVHAVVARSRKKR